MHYMCGQKKYIDMSSKSQGNCKKVKLFDMTLFVCCDYALSINILWAINFVDLSKY